MASQATARAQAFVAEHTAQAQALGQALTQLIDQPDAFVDVLREGFTALADPAYAVEQERVAPGSGAVFGVRSPLLAAAARQVRAELRRSTSSSALYLAERLVAEPEREIVLFSHVPLARALPDDPERTWQIMRRLARAANNWIAVDELAELYAKGVLLEQFRWAELEQLVYSRDRWERRLVGSTVARLPFELPKSLRPQLASTIGLMLIKSLIGDAEMDVQKSLSWALRSWNEVDQRGVEDFLIEEARDAKRTNDGHRAWVVRDALTWPGTDPRIAADIRQTLEGVRRLPGAPSTSAASSVAGQFKGLDELSERAVAIQGDRQRMAGR
jgi:3-methyladenine DNA glycosylase AlkD